jgi:phospholipase D1/2
VYSAEDHTRYYRMDYIRFYHLRSYDRINAPLGFIKEAETNSTVKFHEAQIALSRQWVAGDLLTTQKEVVVVIPQDEPPQPGDKPVTTKTERVPIPVDDNAAREVVERFEDGAKTLRSDADVADTVAQHMLSDRTSLLEEAWLGTQEEELNA